MTDKMYLAMELRALAIKIAYCVRRKVNLDTVRK